MPVADVNGRVVLAERLTRIEEGINRLGDDQAELRAWMTQTLSELKGMGEARQQQIGRMELEGARRAVQFESTQLKMQTLTGRMRAVERLTPALKMVMWIGAALGASVIALIWSLLTGQAQVVF